MTDWSVVNTETVSLAEEPIPVVWVKSSQSLSVMPERYENGLWQSGVDGEARAQIINAIQGARELVCLSSFILSDDGIVQAIVDASRRGIPCYVLTMLEQHLEKDLRNEDEYSQQVVEAHKRTLNTLAGLANVRTAPHLHTKLILVDPKSLTEARGFLSTANLSQKALTQNVELILSLDGERTRQLFEQFKVGFWEEAEHESLEVGDLRPIGPSGRRECQMKGPSIPMTTRGTRTLRAKLIDLVSSATDELWLSSFGIEMKHEATRAIIDKARRGTKVHVFLPMRQKNMDAAIELSRNGAVVYSASSLIHTKTIVSVSGENVQGMVYTANIEARGLDSGFESGIVLTAEEALQLRSVLSQWSTKFDYRLNLDVKRGQLNGPCVLWNGKDFEAAEVIKTAPLPAKSVVAETVEGMKATRPPSFPQPGDKNPILLPQSITYTWTVLPPKLPKGARESPRKGKYPIFEHKGSRYLIINNPQDLEDASREAKNINAKVVVE